MGIFDIFKRKDKRVNHSFSEEERELSLRKRQLNSLVAEAETNLKLKELELRRKELELEMADLYDTEEDDSFESILAPFIPALMSKMGVSGNIQPPDSNSPPPDTKTAVNIPDSDLIKMWEQIPEYYKAAAKFMKDESIRAIIKQQIPQISENSLDNAIRIIRNK